MKRIDEGSPEPPFFLTSRVRKMEGGSLVTVNRRLATKERRVQKNKQGTERSQKSGSERK